MVTARTAKTAALLLAGGLLLTGCTNTPDPTASPTPPSSATAAPSASATETPVAEPAPAPAPAPEPEPATCDTVLTPEAVAALAEQGLDPIDANVASYPLAQQFAAAGGVACSWGKPQTDIRFTVVQLAILESEQDVWARVLDDNGYVVTDDPVPGARTGPIEPGSGMPSGALAEPTRVTFTSVPHVLADLTPAQ